MWDFRILKSGIYTYNENTMFDYVMVAIVIEETTIIISANLYMYIKGKNS